MNLYRVEHDGESYYVEATTFGQAVNAWRIDRIRQWIADGEFEDGDQESEPNSVERLSTNARVIVFDSEKHGGSGGN